MASGIYRIAHEGSGKAYIGSSVDVERRRGEHEDMLFSGTHHCWRLQEAWNRHGGVGFRFDVVEWVPPQQLRDTEQRWINSYGRRGLYNTRMTVDRWNPADQPMCCGTSCAGMIVTALFLLLLFTCVLLAL